MEKEEVKKEKTNGFLNVNVIYLISFAFAMLILSYFAMNLLAKGI